MPSHHTNHPSSGFSLIETLIAIAILSLAVGGIYCGLLKVNDYAETRRLSSCATAIVWAQIDQALAVRPFYPAPQLTVAGDPFDDTRNNPTSSGTAGIPTKFMVTHTLGAVTTKTVGLFMNSDALASGSSTAAAAVVSGTLTTIVNEANITTGAAATTTGTSALRRINVNLTYLYRGRSYNIQMSALRAPDQ